MHDVGIVGGSGYTGAELLRLGHGHPDLGVAWATGDTQAGTAVAALYPSLAAAYPDMVFDAFDPALAAGVDLVFLALPHGASQRLVPELLAAAPDVRIVDLAADFRLRDPAAYERWYGEAHRAPDLLDRFAYGLPELHREDIVGARAVAAPGCYPTAAALALAPLVRGRAWSRPTGSSSTPPAGCRARAGPRSTRRTSARSTRTSWPTASSTTATRPRSSRPPAPPSCSPPTWPP